MQKLIQVTFFLFFYMLSMSAHALLSMELTRGVAGAIPIAVVPFSADDASSQDVSTVIASDLKNSGRFKVSDRNASASFPKSKADISDAYFRRLGTDHVVVGRLEKIDKDQYSVSFQLLKMFHGPNENPVTLTKEFTASADQLRSVAHRISDLIYEKLMGKPGIFSTRIAYVVINRGVDRPAVYTLEVADQDGYEPQTILKSKEPIMSPSWSPDGSKLAYVSFEKRYASIYLHDVSTGERELLSDFPGINGAPAWSPDGKRLALVLSKNGAPNIYIMSLATGKLTQLTNDFYINTEPSWAPDGRSLVFTSNRAGGPQIYKINVAAKKISRISYDGKYNARASYTKDGKHISMIHRADGIFKIALLDLDSGTTKLLTSSAADTSSPSVAPNGSMILYDTFVNGQNMLGMVSSDGGVQLVLPARNGQAQDPAWSPFLS